MVLSAIERTQHCEREGNADFLAFLAPFVVKNGRLFWL